MNYPQNCQWFEVYRTLPNILNFSRVFDDGGLTDGGILVKPSQDGQRTFAYTDLGYFKRVLEPSSIYKSYRNAGYIQPYNMQFDQFDYEKHETKYKSNKPGCYASFYTYLGKRPEAAPAPIKKAKEKK